MKKSQRFLLTLISLICLANAAQAHYDPKIGGWLNRDPSGEEGGLNLYGVCGNDPVGWWDILGLKFNVKGSGGVSDSDAQKCWDQAKQHLGDTAGGKLLQEMEASTHTYDVHVNNTGDSSFDPEGGLFGVLNWDCCLGVALQDKSVMSPALVLAHELDHMQDSYKDRKGHAKRHREKDPDYDDKEEKRVIEGIENETAKILKEPIRKDHKGWPVRTKGPGSVTPQIPIPWQPWLNPDGMPSWQRDSPAPWFNQDGSGRKIWER